ncbi:MAG: polysaccharide biosynthesis tyrosine autokinase [Terricaulis sp.]|nr:polysaccharide biosynthesis tyrosine autokinase [Terricaulis sp.]
MNMMNQMDSPNPNQNGAAPMSLADMLGINAAIQMIRRRFLIMALVGVVAAVAAFAYFMSRPQTYAATSLVNIISRQERVLDNQSVVGELPRETSAIDSEIEMLRSPALMRRLADAMRAIQDPTAAPAPAETAETERARANTNERDPLADGLAGQISVRRRGMTYVIEITARDQDPARAQLIANTYADVYIASQIDSRIQTNERANTWLGQRLAELRDDVREKESAAETFRIQSGMMAAQGSSLVETQITNVQNQVLQAQADLAEKEARYQQLRQMQASGSSVDTIGTALSSGTIQSLRDREAEIARRQSDLENRYLPTHPAVQAVRAEREDVERQIEAEIRRISANLANEVEVARARLRTLQNSLHQVTAELSSNSADGVRLRELEREATASRQVYEAYLRRYEEIANQDQLNMTDARLMAYAQRPNAPVSPNMRVSLVLCIMLGLFLGAGAGVLREIFDQSVKNADDLEAQVGVPAIASIPSISSRMMRLLPPSERTPAGYLIGRPMSAFTEALRVLRTVIVYSNLDFSKRVVAVTSAVPDEGKTTIAVCLARIAAMSGQKAIVVDCDLRKQSLNDIVDVDTDVGILHVLAGEKSWRDAVVRDPASDADVLPVATPSFTPRDVFGSDAMAKLVDELRQEYDLVVLDCAPILAVAETRIIVKQADATVIVARAGKSAVGAVRGAVQQTEGAGGKVLGVALNCVQPQWQSYGDSLYFHQAKSYYSVS